MSGKIYEINQIDDRIDLQPDEIREEELDRTECGLVDCQVSVGGECHHISGRQYLRTRVVFGVVGFPFDGVNHVVNFELEKFQIYRKHADVPLSRSIE